LPEAHDARRPRLADEFMRDYVDHLEHHLRQIEALGPRESHLAPAADSPEVE
jgi:hypothetical protein